MGNGDVVTIGGVESLAYPLFPRLDSGRTYTTHSLDGM
jgi:hypothetical protein